MKKVLIGCAIAVAVVVVAGIGGTVYLVQKFKSVVPDEAATAAVEQALLERDGPLSSYVPPLDGVPRPEAVEGYLHILRSMAQTFAADGEAMTDFFGRMSEDRSFLSKLADGVRGGVGMTRAVTHAVARVDSLLLETGVSEGELAWVHALHRYGMMGYEAPEIRFEGAFKTEQEQRKTEREATQVIEGIESDIEAGLREVLLRQQEAIAQLEDPRPEYAAQHAWLSELLDARSLFEQLRSGGLLPQQAAAFAALDLELRELAPRGPGAYFLESVTFGNSEDGDGGEVDFSFGN